MESLSISVHSLFHGLFKLTSASGPQSLNLVTQVPRQWNRSQVGEWLVQNVTSHCHFKLTKECGKKTIVLGPSSQREVRGPHATCRPFVLRPLGYKNIAHTMYVQGCSKVLRLHFWPSLQIHVLGMATYFTRLENSRLTHKMNFFAFRNGISSDCKQLPVYSLSKATLKNYSRMHSRARK